MVDGTWEQDPTGRHELRWRDGQGWTGHVADGGEVAFDDGPVPAPDGPPPVPSAATDAPAGGTGDTGAITAAGSAAAGGTGDGWGAPLRAEAPNAGAGPISQAPPAWPAPEPGGTVATTASRSSSGGGWSTGAKVAAWIGGIVLLVGSWGIGFVMGAASEVAEGFGQVFEEGFDGEFGTGQPPDLTAPSAGVLTPGDRVSGSGSGSVVTYELRAPGGAVEVEVLDADFDSVLELYDADGQQVARDDDGGDGFNSLLRADVPAGTYTLVVDAFAEVPDGPFELVVR